MADPVARATIDVLTSLVTPALFTDENLRCLVIGRMGNLSLEHGNSDASCYAYTAVGNVLGLTFGDYQAGFRFGQLGLDLADQSGMEREVREALFQKREYAVEFRIVLPDGTVKHLESIGHPSLSSQGELIEIIATDVDVTERVSAQEQAERLRQLELDLAHMNRLSMMGELTASLAHEILHPIATARNNARAGTRFLDMSPPNLGEVREALSCIVRDADRAKDIVGRVRDHVKKAPPRKDQLHLNEAINEVIVIARSAIDKNKVSVRTDFMANSIPVEGDRVQLQQVVLNLILNAVEAMNSVEEGARELSIRTEENQTGGVLVAVRDSGPGIVDFERVFDPFYTTKTSGLGMGLAICRSIIDAHGGRLWVDANEPRGAVFRFTLPAAHKNS